MKARIFICFLLSLSLTGRVCGQNIETVVQAGHYGSVTTLSYSPDGLFIATGSSDKTVILWRTSDAKQIRTLKGNNSLISKIEFNPQVSSLLSLGADGTCMVFDINTGEIIAQMKAVNDRFTCASFHPDGQQIVLGTKKSSISVWNLSTGEKSMEINAKPRPLYSEKLYEYPESGSVSFSRDGKYILAGVTDYTAIVWDTKTGMEIKKYKRAKATCSSCVTEALITSDNKYIITAYSDSVKVFDMKSGTLVREFYGQGGSPAYLAISSDNKLVAGIEYGVAEVWNIQTGELLLKAGNYSGNKVLSLAFSPDGKSLITGYDKRFSEIWDIESGKKLLSLKGYLNQVDESILNHSYMYWAALTNEVKLSPDGSYIAIGRTGNNAKLIDFKTGKVYKTLRGHSSMVISLCFSSDGKYLATGGLDGKAIVWDVETGEKVREISFPDTKLAIFSVDISSDKSMLATADWGGYVAIWDIKTGDRIRSISRHDGFAVYKVKFMPSGVYYISAGLDGKLKLIEIDTGEEIRRFIGHTELVNSINLNPAGDKFVTSGWDGTVRIWDFLSGIQLMKIKAHQGGVYSASFDKSGKYLVSGGDDFLVKHWDASSGKLISQFSGHQGGVGDVNITPGLGYIISGSRDGSVKIWDVNGKKEIVSLIYLNENDWFIRNSQGYFDASEGAYNSISFVKGMEIYSIDQFFNEFYRPGLYTEAFNPGISSFRQNIMQTIDQFPPPSVEIVIPEAGTSVEKPFVTFMVKVTNNGGGAKEFKVMHNGKRQEIDASDLKRMSKEGQYAMETFDLNLVPGDNEITVSAFSNGDIESGEHTVNITYNGLQKTSDVYVLSVGINLYENENLNLTYARSDAEAFSSFMSSKGKNLFNKTHTYSLFDKDATREKILSTLDEISGLLNKEDVFMFFYAGHGSTEGSIFYFITSEITSLYQQDKLKNALRVNELQDKFKMLPALKQVVFIDACQSGSSVELLAMRGASEEKALAQLSRSSGIHVMASSESDQQSAEIKSLGHGVFTYVLLEALNGKADGAPADSKITVYEIKSYIDDQVPEISYRLIRHKQFPSTFSIGHDFPVALF